MNHPYQPITVQTTRLAIRPFSLADVGDHYAYASDPEMYRYSPDPPADFTMRAAEEDVAGSIVSYRKGVPNFAVEFGGHVIGDVFLNIDLDSLVANLGYSIARKLWGRGFATEAAGAVVDLGFRSYGLSRVWSGVSLANQASVRVLEKIGMTREAVGSEERCRNPIARKDWADTDHEAGPAE